MDLIFLNIFSSSGWSPNLWQHQHAQRLPGLCHVHLQEKDLDLDEEAPPDDAQGRLLADQQHTEAVWPQ